MQLSDYLACVNPVFVKHFVGGEVDSSINSHRMNLFSSTTFLNLSIVTKYFVTFVFAVSIYRVLQSISWSPSSMQCRTGISDMGGNKAPTHELLKITSTL